MSGKRGSSDSVAGWREVSRVLFGLLIVLSVGLSAGCGERGVREFAGSTMGTHYLVKVVGPVTDDRLAAGIQRSLDRVEGLMSTYMADSELSRVNRAEAGSWLPISQETAEVLRLAIEIGDFSAGKFDMTVGPLVDLWGFGPAGAATRLPTSEEIGRAKALVGYRHVVVRAGGPGEPEWLLRKTGDVSIDLSAVAKGYGVDVVARFLEAEGVRHYMVEVGGEVRVRGRNGEGRPWHIAIESPLGAGAAYQRTVRLVDMAIATSGDYRNYFEMDGKRYSHTIDPETGRPVTHNLASVTVLDREAARADALATALTVMGPGAGLAAARAEGIAAYFIVRAEDGFDEFASEAFERALTQDDGPAQEP